MAIAVLAINNTVGEAATFTLTTDTLVWVHGSNGNDARMALDVKGDDGKHSSLTEMVSGSTSRSGVLPAGEYRVTRLGGTCGFQRAG